MRKSFDGLSGLVRNELGQDPSSGDVFIFINGRGNQIRLLLWEGDGYSLYCKRLEGGTYEIPSPAGDSTCVSMRSDELMLILQGITLQSVQRRKRYDRYEKNASIKREKVCL